jgi:hypothetical protein
MNTLRSSLLLLVAAASAVGCAYDNSSGTQETPPTARIETEPSGAILYLRERNMQMKTPAEVSFRIREDEEIEVRADGYYTWHGTIVDIPRVADRTYKLTLSPR